MRQYGRMTGEGIILPVAERGTGEVQVAIVGAGFGGLGAAIELKRAGIDDFVILERAQDVGGTWLANTYPGCQCDVPSNLYSFSYLRKADWTHAYPEQPQILDYLRDCTRRFGLEPHVRFGCELLDASWDQDARRWRLHTSEGEVVAQVLIVAPGLLSEPRVPPIPGLQDFRGPAFHSAAWDHDHDLTGDRVALLGTGASAIQIGPRIQPRVGRLLVFQRTPPWIIPHPDRSISSPLQRAYGALPGLQRLARGAIYALREAMVPGMALDPRLLKLQETAARGLMRSQVRDPRLRAQLTPEYSIGCKRVLLSNDWYPMLQEPNVELLTAGVREVREQAIVTADGLEHEVDAIILATGFKPTDPPIARRLRGREGRTLAEAWDGSPEAYLGTAVAGFPNLFVLFGPNVNLGHSSIVYMLESQIRYVRGALDAMRTRGLATVEVRPEVQKAWNAKLQQRLARSVWNTGGCGSWYLDSNGRNSIMWPGFTFEFRRRTRRFELGDYAFASA